MPVSDDERMVKVAHVRQALDYAFWALPDTPDDADPAIHRHHATVRVALADYLMLHPELTPERFEPMPPATLVAAMVAWWPEEDGSEWLAELLEPLSADAAREWRALAHGNDDVLPFA